MIICSCAVISDHDIEMAVLDIMSGPDAPIPTPGVVYRQLEKKLKCCGCLPVTVAVIYEKLESLESERTDLSLCLGNGAQPAEAPSLAVRRHDQPARRSRCRVEMPLTQP